MSPTDYVTAAGQSDQFEIQEGRLAQKMGAAENVRAFGARMIHDHTKSTQMVMAAAAKDGLPPMPPPSLTPDQQQMLDQLRATSGPAFDKLYVQQQLQAHHQALQVQQAYAQHGSDVHLRHAAEAIVPVVETHITLLNGMA